jgi:peroxiredoxin
MIDPHTLPDDLPRPVDDGAAAHLPGQALPQVALASTDGADVSLAELAGRTIVYAYPRTGRPGEPSLVDDWDLIPGARGCTPESCGSDEPLELTGALRLPTFDAAGQILLKRLTMLVRDGAVERVWYPVFPPDRHATEVLEYVASTAANPA